MNLLGLKTRTINILNALDATHFQNYILAIEKIEAKSASGFSDIEAKAQVMYFVLTALLSNGYYQALSDPVKLLLAQIIFNDFDNLSQTAILSQKANIPQLTERLKPKSSAIEDAQAQLIVFTHFLQSIERFRQVYESRKKSRIFMPVNQNHRAFRKMETDVYMDQDKKILFSEKKSIGTTGLACCVAVFIYGKNRQNKTVVNVSHISSLTPEIVKELKSGLIKKYNETPEESIEIYLAGGCIGSLHNEISILMETDLGISDMRLGLSDGSLEEGSCVVIQGKDPDNIMYCFDQPDIPKLTVAAPALTSSFQANNIVGTSSASTYPSNMDIMESEKTSCASSSYSFFKPHAQDETFLQWVTRKEAEEANQQGSHQQDTLMTDPDTDTAILKM